MTQQNLLLIFSLLVNLSFTFQAPRLRLKFDIKFKQNILQSVSDFVNDDDMKLAQSFKTKLLQLGASYDRGYGASTKAREEVETIISSLKSLNPTSDVDIGNDSSSLSPSPLTGSWRMIWTTAYDVLILGASPVTTVGAIYQVFDFPIVTNIIDFLPRVQSLFLPPWTSPSLLRAKVTTRASSRPKEPLRVGLVFESVELQPEQFFGVSVNGILPPLGFDLPQIPFTNDSSDSPGYFDVIYLDEEMLIIQQNAPGGKFVLSKTDNFNP
jgi:PAP_fibrillin